MQSHGAIDEAQKQLRRIVPWVVQQGVDAVSTDVLVGTPYVEISRHVLRHGHDLVLASSQIGGGIKDYILGTTAINLLRKCPCAVWIVKPRNTHQPPVMVAIDAPVGRPAEPFALKILDLAAALARMQGVPLHVVHCWDVEANEGEMLRSEISDETRRAILVKHEEMRKHALEQLLAPYRRSVQIETHLPRGVTQPKIVTLAEQHGIGLVVMGTASRVGIPGLLVGNSVERLLEATHCDVLAVKPDEFRTSVSVPITSRTAMELQGS